MCKAKCFLLFDWSGTLSDDRLPVFTANNLVLEEFGAKPIEFQAWLDSRCSNAVNFARFHGILDRSDDEIQKCFEKHLTDVKKKVKPFAYPGIDILLNGLKEEGHHLGLISSHPQEDLEQEAKEYGVHHLFELIAGSVLDKTETIRNASKVFYATHPDFIPIYIGDTIQDVRSSKAAGVVCFAVWSGYHPKEVLAQEGPDYIAKSVHHIHQIIDSLDPCLFKENKPFECAACGKDESDLWKRVQTEHGHRTVTSWLCRPCFYTRSAENQGGGEIFARKCYRCSDLKPPKGYFNLPWSINNDGRIPVDLCEKCWEGSKRLLGDPVTRQQLLLEHIDFVKDRIVDDQREVTSVLNKIIEISANYNKRKLWGTTEFNPSTGKVMKTDHA